MIRTEWTTIDEAAWRNFLGSVTGQRLLGKFLEGCPVLLDGADVNKTLVRNGEVRAWNEAIRLLTSLSFSEPLVETDSESYPDPTDDSKWDDGKKLVRK